MATLVEIVAATVLLAVSRFIFETASASAYVYPKYDYGQAVFALVLFGLIFICLVVLFLIRLVQRRLLSALVMLVLLCLTFLIPETPDRFGWKFNTQKASYEEAIRADSAPHPKYKIFDWGNYNLGLGGGVAFEAVVYDERDNINLPENLRSNDWRGSPGLAMPQDRWITADPPDCPRRVESFGGHFYFVRMVCS